VFDNTLFHRDLGSGDLPFGGGGGDQHLARRGGGQPQLHPRIRHRGRAAGSLQVENQIAVERSICRGELGAHLRPVGIEFFGDDGAEACRDALALVEMLDDHRHRIVGRDPDESIRHRRHRRRRRILRERRQRHMRGDYQGGACCRRALQQIAA
jgi:hypothetical protein